MYVYIWIHSKSKQNRKWKSRNRKRNQNLERNKGLNFLDIENDKKKKKTYLADLRARRGGLAHTVFSALRTGKGGLSALLVWHRDAAQVQAAEIHGPIRFEINGISDITQRSLEENFGDRCRRNCGIWNSREGFRKRVLSYGCVYWVFLYFFLFLNGK